MSTVSSLFIHSSLLGHYYSALGGMLNILIWISFFLLTTCRFDLFALFPRFCLSLPPALRAGIFTVSYIPFVEPRDPLSYTPIVRLLLAGRSILESIYCFSSSHGAFSRVGDRIDLLDSFQHSSVSRSLI